MGCTVGLHCRSDLRGWLVRDGQPDDRAQIIFQGRQGEESVTVEPTAEGEKFHLWLSKESSTNNLELIIYERAQPDGDSLMINPHMPVLNRMWGQCEVSQSKTLVEQ